MDQNEDVNKRPKKHNHFYASIMAIDPSGKILLGKRRKDGLWTPPAGSSHPHETPIQTAIRETFEETGLVVKPFELQPLPTLDTDDRRVCHVFLWICPPGLDMHKPTSNLDPDHEVSEWVWFDQRDVPQEIHHDPNRAESVKNAYMKYYGIMKGGPGSGVKGHVTEHEGKIINLTNKLTQQNPFDAHLDKLKNGAVMEGVTLRSGKPLYMSTEAATAHGYTPNDFKEAANIHYDKAQAIATNIEKIKELKKPVPPAMEQILKIHKQQFKANMGQAEHLGRRMAATQAKINEIQKPYKDTHDAMGREKVKKSDEQAEALVQRRLNRLMERRPELAEKHPEWISEKSENCAACQDLQKKHPKGVDAGKYERCVHHIKEKGAGYNPWAVCTASMKKSNGIIDFEDWLDKIERIMAGYQYGEDPRIIVLEKGTLHLVKVDNGLYSGIYKDQAYNPESIEYSASPYKVKLDKMDALGVVSMISANDWVSPHVLEAPMPILDENHPGIGPVLEKLNAPIQMSEPQQAEEAPIKEEPKLAEAIAYQPAPTIFDKIRVLELLAKLVN